MCLPTCTIKLAEAASRHGFLKQAALAACATTLVPAAARGDEPPRLSFQRVVDLTHTLSPSFPMTWPNPFLLEQVSKLGGHQYWLGHGKWGLENVAGLAQLPPKCATIVVGLPKIAGCTGGPSRVFALL